ncbi:MAG: hypothetical protein AB7E85_02425 [Pseudobdellovibrionaceae bacterium]
MRSAAQAGKLKKRKWKRWVALTVLVLGGGIYWWGVQPIIYQGSILFGICRTYVELNSQYPSTINFIDLRERGPKVSVEYVTSDPFGQRLTNEATCTFKRGPNQEVLLESFRFKRGLNDRRYRFEAEDPAKIEAFNATIPIIAANPPPLFVLGPGRTLEELKR